MLILICNFSILHNSLTASLEVYVKYDALLLDQNHR